VVVELNNLNVGDNFKLVWEDDPMLPNYAGNVVLQNNIGISDVMNLPNKVTIFEISKDTDSVISNILECSFIKETNNYKVLNKVTTLVKIPKFKKR